MSDYSLNFRQRVYSKQQFLTILNFEIIVHNRYQIITISLYIIAHKFGEFSDYTLRFVAVIQIRDCIATLGIYRRLCRCKRVVESIHKQLQIRGVDPLRHCCIGLAALSRVSGDRITAKRVDDLRLNRCRCAVKSRRV